MDKSKDITFKQIQAIKKTFGPEGEDFLKRLAVNISHEWRFDPDNKLTSYQRLLRALADTK